MRRFLGRAALLALLASTAVGTASCGDASDQDERVAGVITLAISESTAPALASTDGEDTVYQVTREVALPLREPNPSGERVAPYPRALWYESKHLKLQLSYVVSNLGDEDATVELLVDGWNEFIRYSPSVEVTEEGLNADKSCVDRLMVVPAKGRVAGRVSWDDFDRMAKALATIMVGRTATEFNPFHVVDPHTRLETDPLTAKLVPPVIDGITGFDLSLRATSKVKVALEATLEMVDHTEVGEHLLPKDGSIKYTYRPPRDRYRPVTTVETTPP